MSSLWRSCDSPEQIAEYEREDEFWKEFYSHPENVERMKIEREKLKRSRVGVKFYCAHTKEEVDAELSRLSKKFMEKIANTDITYLYNRPYSMESL